MFDIESHKTNSLDIREKAIPFPHAHDGYVKVLLTGTTGAGKTTLLRHLIGCNHHKDRFPSTSTARTTTAEIEIITSENDFCGVVTFMSKDEVHAYIEECIQASCLHVIEDKSNDEVMESLLSHQEQRFRLSYILGSWDDEDDEEIDDEEIEEEDDKFTYSKDDDDKMTEGEQVGELQDQENRKHLQTYLTRIRKIAYETHQDIANELGDFQSMDPSKKETDWRNRFEESLHKDHDFMQLVYDIMKEVEKRFDFIKEGEFHIGQNDWPTAWTYSSSSRELFLKQLRWFSSNHYKQFGKLLTPLVDGMRVRGPFFPKMEDMQTPKLVLIDGEGIGHVAKSVSSISTRITRRFADVSLILIVDNAKQPMQAAPLELLRSIGSSGNASKLAIALTHFEEVIGDNLRNHKSKCHHVFKSVRDAIDTLKQSIGSSVSAVLKERSEHHIFYLGYLDREICEIPSRYKKEMQKLISLMQHATSPHSDNVTSSPIYSLDKVRELKTTLQKAMDEFLNLWKARLGIIYQEGMDKEHWARIKALCRRLALAWANEYNDLKPVADLVAQLQGSISKWLDSPSNWTHANDSKEIHDAALDRIRSAISPELFEFAEHQIAKQQLAWDEAYGFSGKGSSYQRADRIDRLYTHACNSNSLNRLFKIVRKAVEDADGQFICPL